MACLNFGKGSNWKMLIKAGEATDTLTSKEAGI